MKREMLIQIIRKIKAKPALLRKFKIFIAISFVGLLLTGILAIWAGFAVLNKAASHANKVIQSPSAQAQIADLKLQAQHGFSQVEPLNCWIRFQSLLAIEPWLARHFLENLNNLKIACIGGTQLFCKGSDCSHQNELETTEGVTIDSDKI